LNVEQVREPGSRDHRDPGSGALQDNVRGDRGAVHDQIDRLRANAGLLGRFDHAPHDLAVGVERHDVCKRTARIDADPQRHGRDYGR